MHLDLDCLTSFVALAQEQHYGRAAARLHLSTSALSKRVQRLEGQVGARLLQRGPGGVLGLTPAGGLLAASAGPLLHHAQAVVERAHRDPEKVTLGIPDDGGSGGVEAQDLTAVRRLFAQRHPAAALICRRTPLPEVTNWLLEGLVDVQVTAGAVRHRAAVSTPLNEVRLVAALPEGSDTSDGDCIHVDDLVDRPMLHDPGLPDEFMRPFWLGDLRPARCARLVDIEVTDADAVIRAVATGTGVTVLLAAQARVEPAGIRVLPLVGAPPLLLHAARRRADTRPVVQGLIEVLRERPLVR